jgi:nucleotide-binding universal stress UspA family protein
MAYRKIIVPVTGGPRDAAVTKAALDVAKTFGCWVNAVYVRPDASEVLPYLGEGISAGVVQEILDAAAEAAKKSGAAAKDAVHHAAAEAGVPVAAGPPHDGTPSVTFRTRHGVMNDVMFDEAALADLFVFDGASLPETPNLRDALETVLLSARRPVLLTPEAPWRNAGSKIAIAWDGGLAASHAVTAAMPWLKRANAVEILSAGAGAATQTQMDRLRDYLRVQNVNAVEHSLSAGDPGTGAALLDAAQRAGADLLVMGGYGHSRLREMILGGVTRHVLNHVAMPVLMAH